MLCWEGCSSLDPFCQDTDLQAAQPKDLNLVVQDPFHFFFLPPPFCFIYLFYLSLSFLSVPFLPFLPFFVFFFPDS